ncbi:hypothetical protein H6G89_16845 [Oscillatoria sp. FACHB-1407]|uniref:hypothetical protein n=1 Tax=Oscillatoria sp. FACHB-1407 TaxID=2692847 RepID=UPI001682D2FB|nr:hypothetical protein [Oscillatoria sp. FACHB-1407]MBD2462709.1 hypothetical protein [Oscillatoria sp. FACHB-1407]
MDSSESDLDQLIQEIRQAISSDPSILEVVRSLQQKHRQEHGVDPVWDELLAKLDDYMS